MGIEEELRNRMGISNDIEEEIRNRMGISNGIEEEIRNRMGISNGIEEEIRNRIGISNGMEEEIRNRMGISNGIEEEIRNRMGTNNGMEEELRNRMGFSNGMVDQLRNRMGLNNETDGNIQNRLALSNEIDENMRNRVGLNIEEELRNRMGFNNGIEQDFRNRMGLNNELLGEIRNRGNKSMEAMQRGMNGMEDELRRRVDISNGKDVHNKMLLNTDIEEELRKRSDLNDEIEHSINNHMSFLNSSETMRRQQTFEETLKTKNSENHQSDKESEPNSSHLDETIEAVARNDFDYEPVIKSDFRRNCNQFMDNFSIKQEPIDYDVMAANLTAGLMNPDRRHMCAHCCKGFRSRQQLLQHSLVHSNLRKYHCNYCERSFKQLSHLHQHHRIHTGEKPYTCPLDGCGKAFPQLSNLQHHIRNHDKLAESQFQCHLCDRSYPNEATLKAHNTRMHIHSKLIPDLQKTSLSLSQQKMPVSNGPVLSDSFQPRQRKRKATRPQHINERSVIPFSSNHFGSGNQMYNNMMGGNQNKSDYVYILDSDDESSQDIPMKRSEVDGSNNNFYISNGSQKENFYHSQKVDASQSKRMTLSDNDDRFFKENDNSTSVHSSNPNFRYVNDNAYRHHMSDPRSHDLPDFSNEFQKNKNLVSGSSNEMYRHNSQSNLASNEMQGLKLPMKLNSNEMSQNNNFLSNSANGISRAKQGTVSSNSTSANNHIAVTSNEMQQHNIQRSQLSNEMQRYSEGVGLDLSTNNQHYSEFYGQRSGLSMVPSMSNGMSENHRLIGRKKTENMSNGLMMENQNFSNLINESINNWQQRNYTHQKRPPNEDPGCSSDESESEIERQHFQTPNLGTDVYDDPMN